MKSWKKYYDYRKDAPDRLNIFNKQWFHGKLCLDIGCSSGLITIEIAKLFQPQMILGIDVVESLIDEANNTLRSELPVPINPPKVTSFIPRCLKSQQPKQTTIIFPNNCQFQCQDILNFNANETKYDVITCLNVIKWIHLNEGDRGVVQLFWKIWELLTSDGLAILEYQPWSSYTKNRNTSTKTKENFSLIRILPEQFEDLLTQAIGFEIVNKLGTPLNEAKGFNRPILILKKPRGLNYTRQEREESLAREAPSSTPVNSSNSDEQIAEETSTHSRKKKRKLKDCNGNSNSNRNGSHKSKISQTNPPSEAEWVVMVDRSSSPSSAVNESTPNSSMTSMTSLTPTPSTTNEIEIKEIQQSKTHKKKKRKSQALSGEE